MPAKKTAIVHWSKMQRKEEASRKTRVFSQSLQGSAILIRQQAGTAWVTNMPVMLREKLTFIDIMYKDLLQCSKK